MEKKPTVLKSQSVKWLQKLAPRETQVHRRHRGTSAYDLWLQQLLLKRNRGHQKSSTKKHHMSRPNITISLCFHRSLCGALFLPSKHADEHRRSPSMFRLPKHGAPLSKERVVFPWGDKSFFCQPEKTLLWRQVWERLFLPPCDPSF